MKFYLDATESKVATHTERSAEDCAAVDTLRCFLKSEGRIITNFSSYDRWPNHDGTFEFVPNPDISRRPSRNFMVQIKGTGVYTEKEGIISYELKSLAFPAYIATETTADPGIIFLVLNPAAREGARVFWKYISPAFISGIDFNKSSKVIKFSAEDEIVNSDEGIDAFCKKLERILETHLFIEKLKKEEISEKDALEILEARCKEVTQYIKQICKKQEDRDYYSAYILRDLYDLCYSVMCLYAISIVNMNVDERLAWEIAQTSRDMKFLSDFLKGLLYLGNSIPKQGQSERLMLKYHSYLWDIKQFMKLRYGKDVIPNLAKFPTDMDKNDLKYYSEVAKKLKTYKSCKLPLRKSRYYVQKQVPFWVRGERYFEITLQLADKYATKYNRITIYSTKMIGSKYSVQIAYAESEIKLWGINNKIKILDGYIVSIAPTCLNKLARMVKISTSINHKYNEYARLMIYLTKTGQTLLEFINLSNATFEDKYKFIYDTAKTHYFGEVIRKLKEICSYSSAHRMGQYTLRYAMMNMRESVLEELLPAGSFDDLNLMDMSISKSCYPFEKSPLTLNMAGTKSSGGQLYDILEIINDKDEVSKRTPFLTVRSKICNTGELYFKQESIATQEEIDEYNKTLNNWEKDKGFSLVLKDGLVTIDSYEKTTISILQKLIELSKIPTPEQERYNASFLEKCSFDLSDDCKRVALKNLFVKSQVMLIYGAAGTGKTTLLSYIANMMSDKKKLVLAKTHTALQNLMRRLPKENATFASLDSTLTSGVELKYDIIIVDECSTIDNNTMERLTKKIIDGTKLVLSGDIFQIESIEFGNWFYYAKDIINTRGSQVELLHNWRTNDNTLINLWQEVREKRPIITERLAKGGVFFDNLGRKIFQPQDEDEIVLCLNYDGKFGLNCINQYFQNANTNGKAVPWAEWSFKNGDRILFLDTKRFNVLYNNLKGKIVSIETYKDRIVFTIDAMTKIEKEKCQEEGIEYISGDEDKTTIKFEVLAWDDELEEEERKKTVIPFQLAYAVSIHKAQGLEFNSVKVIIPPNNEEKITHQIFYTAITRAKSKLKIYWSAETMNAIVKSFYECEEERISLSIIKEKLGIKY